MDVNERRVGLCSPLGRSQGEAGLLSSPPETGSRGVTETPLAFLPLSWVRTSGQFPQTGPAFSLPRLRMLPRKVLPWTLQGSLELAVGTGAPVHPQGAPAAQGAACTHGTTSLLLENFSQAVTHSSMVSTRISSGMSEC